MTRSTGVPWGRSRFATVVQGRSCGLALSDTQDTTTRNGRQVVGLTTGNTDDDQEI
jgi:hypothetical protein